MESPVYDGSWGLAVYDNEIVSRTTGDSSLLYENVPYFKDAQVMRGTAVDEAWEGEVWQKDAQDNRYEGTVLEHLLVQALCAFYEVGEHNHIRLRDADWNDAIDMASHRGESVAFTNSYAKNLMDLGHLLLKEKEKGSILYLCFGRWHRFCGMKRLCMMT